MKIAIYHNLPHGGAKRVVYEWVKRLCYTHQVDLFIIDHVAEEFLSLKNVVKNVKVFAKKPVKSQGQFNRIISLFKIWSLSKKVAFSINNGGYDLVLVFQCHVTNTSPVLRYLKIPSIFICHETLSRMYEPHLNKQIKKGITRFFRNLGIYFFILLEKSNAKYASKICTSSIYSIETLYKHFGIYPSLIYLGVDTEFFKPLEARKQDTVLSIGHLNSSKGHEFIIKSLGKIDAKKPKLIIVHKLEHHKVDYKKILYELANENNVEVKFFSSPTDKQLLKIYNSAKLTLCGYYLEPLGLVALESLAVGTPVISVEEAGLRETIIHKKNGLLIERNENIFGHGVDKLFNDTKLRKKMASFGRKEILKNWTWDQSYSKLELLIQSLIKNNRKYG